MLTSRARGQTQRVCVLGYGRLGEALAARLSDAGGTVKVFSRHPAANSAGNARNFGDVRKALEDARFVLAVTSDFQSTTDILGDVDRLDGKIFIQISTLSPQQSVLVEKEASARGGTYIESTAEALETEITPDDRKAWIPAEIGAAALVSWSNQSFDIARRPSVQYCIQKNDACWYSNEAMTFPSRPRSVEIDDAYLDLHAQVVRDRLKRAGIRLGAILNTVLQAP